MRHARELDKASYSKVHVAAVWPSTNLVPLPILDVEEPQRAPPQAEARVAAFMPTPAAPDMPAAVGAILFAAYAALIGAFALATVASAYSIYMITISALFVVTFFTVPRIFFGIEPKAGRRPSLGRFMHDGVQTLTGHSSGKDALVQMLIVPVFLTFAALAMGVAAAVYL
jgi:hypothetical protein